MSADDAFASATRAILQHHADGTLTYSGAAGQQSVHAYCYESQDFLGVDANVGESRWQCDLSRNDVAEPRPGDRITDRNGVEWVLVNRLDADEFMTSWTIERR